MAVKDITLAHAISMNGRVWGPGKVSVVTNDSDEASKTLPDMLTERDKQITSRRQQKAQEEMLFTMEYLQARASLGDEKAKEKLNELVKNNLSTNDMRVQLQGAAVAAEQAALPAPLPPITLAPATAPETPAATPPAPAAPAAPVANATPTPPRPAG